MRGEKKDGLGVFSKLLAGLLKNTRTPGGRHLAEHETPKGGAGGTILQFTRTGPAKGNAQGNDPLAVEDAGEVEKNPAAGKRSPAHGKSRGLLSGDSREALGKISLQDEKDGDLPAEHTKGWKLTDDEAALAALMQPFGNTEISEDTAETLDAAHEQDILLDRIAGGIIPEEETTGISFEEMAALSEAFLELNGEKGTSGARRGRAFSPFGREDDPAKDQISRLSPRRDRETAGEGVEKTGKNPAETRARRKERSVIDVRDWRSSITAQPSQPAELKGQEGLRPAAHETELTVELNGGGKTQGEISAERESRPAASFQDMLARELHQNLNGDIVRHASILLRDGGEGVIRLSLKPESLGNVKIRLEMAENKIVGRIIVESDEALRAFEREIRSLEQAFRDSGFDGAALEMAVASGGGQEAGSRRNSGGANLLQPEEYAIRAAAAGYDNAGEAETPPVQELILTSGGGQPQINMLA